MSIFQQKFSVAESCAAVRYTQLRVVAIFEHKHFHEVE